MRKLIWLLAVAATLVSCGDRHFITDPVYRNRVRSTLQERLDQGNLAAFYNPEKDITQQEREALEFLYAYMPLADLTDYPTSFYLDNVRKTFQAREELPWGDSVPEMLFRHFVLPLRTNNENLDEARMVFYEELKPRVEKLPMKEAILEVNHWCHEKMTYQPSDGRTSAPLASVKTSLGRCGEESTLTVAALRAVGIPARQVYTPRWAHTESNHAWVEAWADGQWWFLGACEPEPILNLGWFNAPASRAMLTHTKVFGNYPGTEEVVLRSPNYTEINLIENYAPTGRIDFTVTDKTGKPVPDARVDFCIYNSSQFFPAVSKYTQSDGRTYLTAGLGDLLVWAAKDGAYGFRKVTFGTDKEVTITLDSPVGAPVTAELMHIVPPPEAVSIPKPTPEQRAENDRRVAREDSIRHAYEATFFNRESAAAYATAHGLPEQAARFLEGSAGNHATIADFLNNAADKERACRLLGSLSQKDLHDVSAEILRDSYDATESILSPRMESEFLSPYKGWFLANIPAEEQKAFSGEGDPGQGARAILAWINENVTVDDNPLLWDIPASPVGTWEGRVATPRSRDLLAIALGRTFGIDMRRDRMTGLMQYNDGKNRKLLDMAAASDAAPVATGRVNFTYTPVGDIAQPRYGQHFSVSKIENGALRMVFAGPGRPNELPEGDYLLCSGNRLSDGSTPVTVTLFHVGAGASIDVPLAIETLPEEVSVIGSFEAKKLPQTDAGAYVAAVLDVGMEPTNHVLRDLAAEKAALEKWGRPIFLLCTGPEQLERLQRETAEGRYGELPATVRFGLDENGVLDSITQALKLRADDLPVVFLGDSSDRVYFVSQGYTIGLGTRIAALAGRLP